jgi:DNA-3-methyladenine glycosylase
MKQKAKRLNREFFSRPAKVVAPDLLGKKIVRILSGGKRLEGVITEVEAYVGPEDKASHSYGGRRTKRNEIMYGRPGKIYVYFTYGMHWLMNFIVSGVGDPQAVLIRGIDDASERKVSGPARVAKHFRIDKVFYGEDLTKSKRIWVEDGIKFRKWEVQRLPRVGINYAEEWKAKPLRFLVKNKNVKV